MKSASPKLGDIYNTLSGVQNTLIPNLHKLCGQRYIDLLLHMPNNVLDRRNTPTIAEAEIGKIATLQVLVTKHIPKPYRNHRRPHIVEIEDKTGSAKLVFFQAGSWLTKALPVGETVLISGKIDADKKQVKSIMHPTIWGTKKELGAVAKLWPMYPLTAGVSHLQVKKAVDATLAIFKEDFFPEWLSKNTVEKYEFSSFYEALNKTHNPLEVEDISLKSPNRIRMAFDEFFAHQLALIHARKNTREQAGIAYGNNDNLSKKFFTNLPFKLTKDQQNALAEINTDLSKNKPMLRLLQGDVGSGKTVVAMAGILRVIENGFQGVIMAPTEILARQHYENAKKWLEPLGITVALLVGSIPAAQKKKLKQHIAEGFANLIIGTHALVQEDVKFDRLGLAVIDEQHRFGVKERVKLASHSTYGLAPDFLVMTATPIPRTLALTAFGDMDCSIIKEKPPGRTPIKTNAVPLERLAKVARSLERLLAKNEQVYWVCPLVEESEKSDLAAATTRFEYLKKGYGQVVGLLHGKMKPKEKEAVMADFQAGKIQILVATTVIEVGVDVPNATAMIIEHAERFGLAQLHQLRGRTGRGSLESSCILLYDTNLTEVAMERLQAMRNSEDGFYLAEKDMELRGAGEILGTKQSGEMLTKVADLIQHKDLIPLARQEAEETLADIKNISKKRKKALGLLLKIFGKQQASKLLKSG